MTKLKPVERVGYDLEIDYRSFAKGAKNVPIDDFKLRDCAKRLKDGRTASPWVEMYAEDIEWKIGGKNVKFVSIPNLPIGLGADGHFIINKQQKLVGIRCLNEKINFERSMYLGKNRPRASGQDIMDGLGKLAYYIVCDIAKDNFWKYWLIESAFLIEQILKGNLDANGWTSERFYRFLECNKYKVD